MTTRRMVLSLLAALVLLSAARVQAWEVRRGVAGAAREIAGLVRAEPRPAVKVGPFLGPAQPSSGAGPLLQLLLIEELKKLKIDVNDRAAFRVTGEYAVVEDDRAADWLIVRVLLRLSDHKGERAKDVPFDIRYRGSDDLVALLAMTVDLEKLPRADLEMRNQKMKQQLARPPLHLAETKVKASRDSTFAVEVLTRPVGGGKWKLLTPAARKGQAFVDIEKGQEFVLRLHNHGAYEAAVSVTIDGIDAFAFFAPADRRPPRFLIAPGKSLDVQGWQLDRGTIEAFRFGSFPDRPGARGLVGNKRLGTITVCFRHCWQQGKEPPPHLAGMRYSPRLAGLGRYLGPLMAAVSLRCPR